MASGLETDTIESFTHPRVADEPVEMAGLPFGDDFFTGQVPVATKHIPGEADERLISLGHLHGRSYVLRETEKPEQVWTDQYGNAFTTLTSKGNNFSRPDMMRSATAPSGFIPYGLQEGDSLLRILRSSRLMREGGVDTEWIVRVEEPKQLNFRGELVEPDEYKQLLITSSLGATAIDGADSIAENAQEASDIAKAIQEMDFFVTLRAMSTPLRISELTNKSYGPPVDLEVLKEIFAAYNQVSKFRKTDFEMLGLPESLGGDFLYKENEYKDGKIYGTDAETYFTQVLPKLLGLNFARMHNLGLTHNFAVAGNLTALGGIVDLDGMRGPALELDDKTADSADFAGDLNYFFGDHLDVIRLLFKDVFPVSEGTGRDAKEFSAFVTNLLTTYLDNREFNLENEDNHQDIIGFLLHLSGEAELNIPFFLADIYQHEPLGDFLASDVARVVEETKVDTKALCKQIYETDVAGNEKELWDLRSADPKCPPTKEQLEEELKLWFIPPDVDPDQEFVDERLMTEQIYPALRNAVAAQLGPQMGGIIKRAKAKFGEDYIASLSHAELVTLYSGYVIGAAEDNLYKLLVSAAEFRRRMNQQLKENFLDNIETEFKPEQDLIETDSKLLDEHFQFWDLHRGKLIRGHSKLSEKDALGLLKANVKPEYFTPKNDDGSFNVFDFLYVFYSDKETVRMVLTDGDLSSWEDTEAQVGQTRCYSIDILQPEDARPTYGIFLIEDTEKHTFRLVYRKLKKK